MTAGSILSASSNFESQHFLLVAILYPNFLSILDLVGMVRWAVDWSASAQYSARRHSWEESIDQSCRDSEYWEIIDTSLGLSYRLDSQAVSQESTAPLEQTL